MGNNCCYPKNKFFLDQIKNEYKQKKKHISILGNFKPYQVFYSNENILNNYSINGLNSMCECDIHISIGNNPTRLILSYIDTNENNNYIKGQTFHIYKIEYKEILMYNDINQYDIYNAIQDYIYINKQYPKNDKYTIAT